MATIESDLPQGLGVPEALDQLAKTLETHLAGQLQKGPAEAGEINSAELERLEWKAYKEGHRAGWIFAEKAPKPLLALLEKGSVDLGEYRYKFSGPEEKPKLFVSRGPVKE